MSKVLKLLVLIPKIFFNLFPFDAARKILRNIAAVTATNIIISIRLSDTSTRHGDVLADKIHIHGHDEFHGLISELRFSVKTEHYHPDNKGGRYYVVHAVRSS